MKVKILTTAKYADFVSKPGLVKAVKLEAGEVAEYPDWYARFIVERGLAEFVGEIPTPTPPVEEVSARAEQPQRVGRKRR